MPRAGTASTALWALAAVLLLLCVSPLLYSTSESANFRHHRRFLQRRAIATVPDRRQGPTHQNPAQAPPEPLLPDAFGNTAETGETVEKAELPSTQLSARAAYLASRKVHQSFALGKRDALRCDDGPCVDGSCCSKDHICGFGPDFCGDGCRSQCEATAMCGEFSENGEMPCGMKLCCSAMGWCGTTASYCHNADPLRGTLPCQAGYGACYVTPEPPGCPYGGGSTSGRHIGYYQSWNVRNRVCNRVSPAQLNTTGYTHLFYSFASINPSTYQIAPAHADDDAMMREFTALAKNGGPQTWIAVGGFDFSDPGTPTHTTWSDVCATKASRTAFISSVKDYMDEYGFQGVDLDWEYPGDPKRGGNKLADVRGFVLLLREMRLAYGSAYGISLTLAPDYWYLRWFDAKALEPYVDFFGFMAYDLHGSWDADVTALGKKVRGQADIREIANNTIPLWFDGLNMAKINFGLAMYGRGYTLADPTCNQLLCPFDKASDPAPCTNSEGVMSLLEIQQLIKRKGLIPQYLPDSMMKQITWDDQWIGYDDEETFSAKKAWADSKCFGGTMVWSIDFQLSGSGDSDDEKYGEVVYVGSQVYEQPTAQCSPPCVMVLPPSTLEGSGTAITMEPYTATLEVGSTTTTVVVTPSPSVTTVTVINYFNYYVTSAQLPGAPLTLRPSFSVPPARVVVTGPDGTTTTRTVSPPPVGGPIFSANSTTPGQEPGDDDEEATSGWPWVPDPTGTLEPGENHGEIEEETVTAKPTVIWPTGVIEPVTNESEPIPPGRTRVSCTSWFFFICISWIELDLKIDFWDIELPPGTIGPGPPPVSLLKLPPGLHVGCGFDCLPPWPKMTVNGGGIVSVPPKPDPCKPTSAMLTIETTSYGTTTTQGTVRTTATRSFSSEFPIVGCAVEDDTISSDVTGCDARVAAPTPRALADRAGDSDSNSAVVALDAESEVRVVARADEKCPAPEIVDAVLFPEDHKAMSTQIQARLAWDKNAGKLADFHVIDAPAAGFTAFIYLTKVRKDYLEKELVGKFGMRDPGLIITAEVEPPPPPPPAAGKRSPTEDTHYDDNTTPYHNDTETGRPNLIKRISSQGKWAPSMISVPPKIGWLRSGSEFVDKGATPATFKYQRDGSECGEQYVYISEDAIQTTALGYANIETLTSQNYGIWREYSVNNPEHATEVASMVVGRENGVCPLGKVTLVTTVLHPRFLRWATTKRAESSYLKVLESLVMMLQDIKSKGRQGKAVVNMSWSIHFGGVARSCLLQILQELDKLNTVLVTSAGNEGTIMKGYPNLFENNGLENLIVVGATDLNAQEASFSNMGRQLTVYAPGMNVHAIKPDGSMQVALGTSLASAMVSGLVAYFRALPGLGGKLDDPARVKLLVKKMRRTVQMLSKPNAKLTTPLIWNGQLSDDVTCITLDDITPPGCPKIDIDDETPLDDLVCATVNGLAARQIGGSCPIDPGNGGGGGGGQPSQGPTKTITYSSGTPSPTCTSGCGELCTDYWCRPDRTGEPVHFTDPTRLPSPTGGPSGPGGGGGGGGGSIPTNCISSTTTQTCDGLGEYRSCGPSTICLATTSPTTPTTRTTSTPSPADCTTNTECFGAKGGPTTVTTCASSLSCSGGPAATATPLSGFPSPSPIPGVFTSCMIQDECDAHPGLSMACDAAAEHFTGALGATYGYGTGTLPSWVCRTGNYFSLTSGGPVGCRIKFERLDSKPETPENVCMWQHGEARQWYANMRAACRDEGYSCGGVQMIDSDMCAMTIEYVDSCPGLADGFGGDE